MFDFNFGIWGAVSTLISGLVGGTLISNFITLRAQKKKANAEAKGSELSNVETAIKIWREMAENLSDELKEQQLKTMEMKNELEKLTKEVNRLTCINSRIVRLLDKITPENLTNTVEEIKKAIER